MWYYAVPQACYYPIYPFFQEIHPSGQGRIDSVKINSSLLRMREWVGPPFRPKDYFLFLMDPFMMMPMLYEAASDLKYVESHFHFPYL